MLIFLRKQSEADHVITTPVGHAVLADYTTTFPKLKEAEQSAVPWYSFNEDPEAFGEELLQTAEVDVVCKALLKRATEEWGADFSIQDGRFKNKHVQDHYTKQLRNWLNPLSGNLGRRTAHLTDEQQQYDQVWMKLKLNRDKVKEIAQLPFFKKNGFNVAGRRDRLQLYRNKTEAARALVGEVTSWPSRYVEKLAVLSLLRSAKLAALQRTMLRQVVIDGIVLDATKWEYLPYYLRGKALEACVSVQEKEDARLLVLGALHDCLNDDVTTRPQADTEAIRKFTEFGGGNEYARWRLLPQVVRYQVMISDLARIMPGGKAESEHVRFEFQKTKLDALPSLGGFGTWTKSMQKHASSTPHDPGRHLPFAAGWIRNEFCPNIVSSRLLLAPLYAGTSGHNQGRIMAWRKLKTLDALPVGLIVSAGYSVLWRLYYDKRVSGFHTMFETLQGTHVDTVATTASTFKGGVDDVVWNNLLDNSPEGKTDVSQYWMDCIACFAKPGPLVHLMLKQDLLKEREKTLQLLAGEVLPRWGATESPDRSAPDVEVWDKKQSKAVSMRLEFEIASNTPLPDDDEF
ncbi:hypothetical protein BO221_10480 [Archangium sp. Cb G35]|uniref:hypothetical protein n=1 Tax=Archangium sp. Cb G35 TaxID=1920190 RepID=UPI00093606A7|nr:hypothetical protein [Archangium sp. Cb G35]OJT24828.1 hypothetical protein BO221_10480 [Archangium sp. Cb G35]